jgi:hypothetical protein
MEGTHRLELEDGRFVLLEANGLILDDYLAMDVEVFGATRPTVEGGAIIMRVERVAEFVESSVAASSEDMLPSSSSISSAAVSVAPVVPSSAPAAVSRASVAPVVSSSAPAVVSFSRSRSSLIFLVLRGRRREHPRRGDGKSEHGGSELDPTVLLHAHRILLPRA